MSGSKSSMDFQSTSRAGFSHARHIRATTGRCTRSKEVKIIERISVMYRQLCIVHGARGQPFVLYG